MLERTLVSPCTFQIINPERRNASSLEDGGVAVGSRVERIENEEQEEDYEGEDEYEDELKAVAESHEAMSRDDTRNSNVSAAPSTPGISDRISSPSKNFDSREVIAVNNSSDEDVASNEAITDEIVDKYDQEVRSSSSSSFLCSLFVYYIGRVKYKNFNILIITVRLRREDDFLLFFFSFLRRFIGIWWKYSFVSRGRVNFSFSSRRKEVFLPRIDRRWKKAQVCAFVSRTVIYSIHRLTTPRK